MSVGFWLTCKLKMDSLLPRFRMRLPTEKTSLKLWETSPKWSKENCPNVAKLAVSRLMSSTRQLMLVWEEVHTLLWDQLWKTPNLKELKEISPSHLQEQAQTRSSNFRDNLLNFRQRMRDSSTMHPWWLTITIGRLRLKMIQSRLLDRESITLNKWEILNMSKCSWKKTTTWRKSVLCSGTKLETFQETLTLWRE